MNRDEMKKIVREFCSPEWYAVGFADIRGLIHPDFNRFEGAISLLRKLPPNIVDRIAAGPTREYFDLYHAVNAELDTVTEKIAGRLRKNGVDALAYSATNNDEELDAQGNSLLKVKVSHKLAATRSGMGWIGKTDLLVTSLYGPRVRLATVLVGPAVLPEFPPIEESLCGSCLVCVRACPASAANGNLWKAGMSREEFYNPFRCREKCRELSKARIHEEISLCGICVSVCPKGKQGQ